LLIGGACTTDAGQSLVILQNALPGDSCDGADSAQFISQGVIDVASSGGYTMRPVLQNRAIASAGASRRAQLEGYNVDITYPGSGSCSTDASLTSFSRLVGVSIEPQSTAILTVELLPAQLIASCSVSGDDVVDVVAEIQFFGEMDGGDLESTTFRYPVQVCDGCLVEDLGMCADLTGSESISNGSSCNPYQDYPVTCCTNSSGQEICPAEQEILALQP
jgi:hypothetical protein